MSASPQTEQPAARPVAVAPVLLTVQEACDTLRISRWTFYRLMQRRELRTVTIGRSRRVEPDAITDYLRSLREHGAES
jgi:excisionase family DNA binding protein